LDSAPVLKGNVHKYPSVQLHLFYPVY